MPNPSIKLTVVENKIENVGGVPVGILVLQYTDPIDVPDASWFIVRRHQGEVELVTVASLADFDNIPTSEPATGDYPYWRTDSVVIKTDYPDTMAEILGNVRRRTQAVIDGFKALTGLPASGTVESFN
ncbi:MAG: hypothetical protein KatS3mg109_0002 [Pirellulaceae bacterium]|nr:MAG: hypothetical protein KatS3mg109_0002 [Pirellulaceae bacterium]